MDTNAVVITLAVVCGFFAAMGRGATQAFFSYMLHVDLTTLVRPIGVISFAVGLVLFVALVGACAWLVARVYNAMIGRESVQTQPFAAAAR